MLQFTRPTKLVLALSALCLGSGLAMAGKLLTIKPDDPRSGAALNLEAAKKARKYKSVPSYSPTVEQLRIHHSGVNNAATDATAQDTQSETTIADLGGGNLLAAWNDSGSFVPAGGNQFTGYGFSSNNGLSWTDGGVLPASGEGDAGDPVLAHDKTTGEVYLVTLGFTTGENLQVFKSTDFGHTFGAPVNGTPGFAGSGEFQDKPWMTVDNFAGSGNGNIYLCWTNFFGGGAEVRLVRSLDHGATFGPAGLSSPVISAGGQGCFVVVSPNHQVNVFYYRGTGSGGQGGDNKLFTRKSTDGGLTFAPEVQVADLNTTTINGNLSLNGGLRSNSFPHAAVNPVAARPYILVTYNDDPNIASTADNGAIYMVSSIDGGATWSAPEVVANAARDQFFPTIAFVNGGERFMVSWYTRFADPDNLMFSRIARLGVLNVAGTPAFNPNSFLLGPYNPLAIRQDPVINPTYMGDYDQLAGGTGTISGTWADNRLGNAFHIRQPDVRFARIKVPPASSNLSLTMSAVPATVALGKLSTVTFNLAAAGGVAKDVFLNIPAPPGLRIVSVSTASGQCERISNFGGCSLGSIPAGASKNVTVAVSGIIAAGTRKIKGTATTSSRDTVVANNHASTTITVTAVGTVSTTYSTGNISVPLPDLTTVEFPVNVPHLGTPVQIVAEIRLDHTFDEDLDISLVAPDGTLVDLSSDNGGAGDNYGSGATNCSGTPTTFTGSAATPITAGVAPFAGAFKPEQPLADSFGSPMDGVWKLRITDDFNVDTGTLFCFKLTIVRVP